MGNLSFTVPGGRSVLRACLLDSVLVMRSSNRFERLRGACYYSVFALAFQAAVGNSDGVQRGQTPALVGVRLAPRCLIVVAATLLLLSSCGVFPESSFELAPSSRLPRWIELPAGLRRDQVKVTLDYYIAPLGRTATLSLYDSQKRRLRKGSGSLRWEHPLTLKNSSPGFAAGYPS